MKKENGLDHLVNHYINKLNKIDLAIDALLQKISKFKDSIQFKDIDDEFNKIMTLEKDKKSILEKLDILQRLREIKKI